MSLRTDPVVELTSFLQQNAGVETIPGDIAALLQLLHYRGEEPVSPSSGKDLGLHPLVIPLTKAADGDYTCLLRWPTPVEGAPIPVVKARGGLNGLKLVAQSTLELAHRLAAEEDHTQGKEADWVRAWPWVWLKSTSEWECGGSIFLVHPYTVGPPNRRRRW